MLLSKHIYNLFIFYSYLLLGETFHFLSVFNHFYVDLALFRECYMSPPTSTLSSSLILIS